VDSTQWDARYAASDLVWSAGPNTWVEQIVTGMPPGRAIDLAAGEGRNAIWLADHGWTVFAVDFSPVAIVRARLLADERLADGATRVTFEVGDLLLFTPPRERFDLTLVVYLHLPASERRRALRTAAECLAPGGRLIIIGHHPDNLHDGVGGPQDASVLYSPEDLADDLAGTGLAIERAARVLRTVGEEPVLRAAVDAVLVARRPHVAY
jgi:SAM-dependent methyltransferase